MPANLDELVSRIRESHFAFPPASESAINSARLSNVPQELLEFYMKCDGALLCDGDDFAAPNGTRYRVKIPRLVDLQTTQSHGYIFDASPFYALSANWWQIADYGDANWLAFDSTAETKGRIIDIFHETVGEPGYHNIVALSLTDMLTRLLDRGGVYWFDGGFQNLGAF